MTWDYRAEWKRRLNKIIKYFKEHEVEIIRTNEYIHSVDLICYHKRKRPIW